LDEDKIEQLRNWGAGLANDETPSSARPPKQSSS
jgi:hypothetical protein